MNVSQPDQPAEPAYPNKSQFATTARKLGIAALGAGLLGAGCSTTRPTTTGGVIAVDKAFVPQPAPTPGRLLGRPATPR